MKKITLFFFGLFVMVQFVSAQNAEVNIPSFDENGLASFLTSTTLRAVIFMVVGVAAAMAVFFLIGNFRMAYSTNFSPDIRTTRFPTPADVMGSIGLPGDALNEYIPQLLVVDNEVEEVEDPRGESKGQRGDH